MGPLLVLLAGLAVAAPTPEAAPAEATVASPRLSARTAAGLEIAADVHPWQLHGHPILVSVAVRNPTPTALTFPDLASRPHLVRFEVASGGGRPQVRYTTPPAQDADLRWTVNPRGERRVLLEIPSSEVIKPDAIDLRIRVQDGKETVTLGPVSLALAWPYPAGAHLVPDLEVFTSVGFMSAWVQRAASGADLYLDVRPTLATGRDGDQWLLAHLDAPVEPLLSASRPAEAWDRHVYWRSGTRSLWYVRLQATEARHAPRRTDLPWPTWDLLARGVSDPQGGLHVPIWIQAPSGRGGEVRVVSIDPQGTPYFRVVVKMDERPQAWSTVDAGGQVRLLLLQGGNLDLYTLSTTAGATMPASGIRLLPPRVRKAPEAKASEDEAASATATAAPAEAAPAAAPAPPAPAARPLPPTSGAAFGILPDTPEHPGGLAIFAWAETGARLLSGAWLSLQGGEIARVEGVQIPAGSQVRTVIPAGYQPFWVAIADAAGRVSVLGADLDAPLTLGVVPPDDVIRPDGQGNLVRVSIRAHSGITATRVTGQAPR